MPYLLRPNSGQKPDLGISSGRIPAGTIPPGKRIVWLASYPKSGNTWLRIFLENLLGNRSEPLDVNKPREYTSMGDMTPFLYTRITDKPLENLGDAEHVALRRHAHLYLSSLGSSVVFAKTHTANVKKFKLPLFQAETTRQAIYVVRNPLDVVDSLSDHWGLSLDATIAHMANPDQYGTTPPGSSASNASVMKIYLSSWSVNVQSWLGRSAFPVLLLKYEDMLADPLRQFSRVVAFLKAPFNKEQIRRAVAFSEFKQMKEQELKKTFVELSDNSRDRAFFRHGKAGRWKDVLSRQQIKRVKRDHEKVMQELGYLD